MEHDSFKPAWWLRGRHAQTVFASMLRRKKPLPLRWERIELKDGDFLDLAWAGEVRPTQPIVLILHGLGGNINSSYTRSMMECITELGWQAVLMHFRGCSGTPNRLARSYHSGETQDLEWIVTRLSHLHPNVPLSIVGYSLGGNVLLKWLGEGKTQHRIQAAVAVSVPFELEKTVQSLNQGFSKIYQWYLLRELKKAHQQKFSMMPAPIEFGPVKQYRTFLEFDNAITAPLHGFKDARHYYTESSSRHYLKTIKTPTLIVHSYDDPFTSVCALPDAKEVSPSVQLKFTNGGGHVGFVAGKYPWKPTYWLDTAIVDFLDSHLS